MRQTPFAIAATSLLVFSMSGPALAKDGSAVPGRIAKAISPEVAPGVSDPEALEAEASYRAKGETPQGTQGAPREGAMKGAFAATKDKPAETTTTEREVAATRPAPDQPATDGAAGPARPVTSPEDAEQLYQLGLSLIDGEPEEDGLKAAVAAFRHAAEAGHPGAAFELGWALETGQGLDPDPAGAAVWYEAAMAGGDARAMNNLGWLYAQGRGVRRDAAQAVALYTQAAEAGEPSAMSNLGWMLENGIGTAQDLAAAAGWYARAAEAGDAQAMLSLGNLHLVGDGVEQNPRKALVWFARARVAGRDEALSYMGEVFEKTEQMHDPERAAGLYIRALEAGDAWPLSRASRSWEDATARALQRRLTQRGVYNGEIDGAIGPASRQAMRRLAAMAGAAGG